jgi:predicted anti-sigma-YlaC factor YlaD
MNGHPDLLDLEAARAGEAAPGILAHVEACGACRAEVDALRDLARRLAPPPFDVPASARARALAVLRPARRRWLPVAAAAALLLALWLAPPPPADVDASGSIDILDAYTLALRIRDGRTRPSWDFNRDGRVDLADVDLLAQQSVALGGAIGR